jgi:hypothetical protein
MAVEPDRFFGRSANLDSIVGEHDLNPVRHGGDKGLQEDARGLRIGLVDQPSDCQVRGAVDGDEEIELALRGLHFGDVEMKIADRVGLELAFRRGFAFNLRQLRDFVTLKVTIR